MSLYDFECDLEPETKFPRVRFNFANGWSASLLIHATRTEAVIAGVAAWPSGECGKGKTELGPQEASSDEAIEWINAISKRERP